MAGQRAFQSCRGGQPDNCWRGTAGSSPSDFTPTFGLNVYNGAPVRVVFHNRFAAAAEAIERALLHLRTAKDREAALRALEAVDRAVMAARRQAWAEAPGKR